MRIRSALRDLPVKLKLHLIVMATVGLALSLSCCAALAYLRTSMRQTLANDLTALADMYGANSTAALTFDDRGAAAELLSGFRAKRSILSAALFAADGGLFAEYRRAAGFGSPTPASSRGLGSTRFDKRRIAIFRRIFLDGQAVGSIYLESDLQEVDGSLRSAAGALFWILLGAFGVAFLLAAHLQTAVSRPIRQLAELAREISRDQDYSRRAAPTSRDDLGQLTRMFNNMLSEIEHRDAQLLANQERLEEKVAERTAELARAKQKVERTCELLEDSRTQLSLALDGASEALWDYDLRTNRTYYSNRLGEMLGFDPREIGDSREIWEALIHPEDRQRTLDLLHDHLAGLTDTYQAEYRLRTRSGDWRWIQARGKVVERAADGAPLRCVGTHLDITERREAEEALARQHYILDNLIEGIPDHIYFKDRDSRFLRANRATVKLFGLNDPAELEGRCDADFFTPEHANQARADELDLLEGRQRIISKEERETWPDGGESWVQTTKLPLRDHSGAITGTLGISRDITQRKRMEADLLRAKEAAEAASRSKSEFLANMSHEIRTPMNGILGMTELALDTELSDQQRDYLRTVRCSAESLMTIINDILDFSKIEAGKFTLDRVAFDLDEVVEESLRTVALSAHQKGLELLYENRLRNGPHFVGDPGRIRQIIINLLGNAIKFTHSGEVRLEVREAADGIGGVATQFTVSDTGIGVAPEWREKIFQAFVQADGSNTRRYGGTGLGLAICSRLVSLMGGRIWLDEQSELGSSFHFTAPLENAQALEAVRPNERPASHSAEEMPAESAANTLSGLRVLVVDDNATSRRILRETLSEWGLDPTLAASGEEALDALIRSGRGFDIAILDQQMPGMNGFTLASQMLSAGLPTGPKLMMLSSVDSPCSPAGLTELGIKQPLSKPVTPANLRRAILKAMEAPAGAAVCARVPGTQPHSDAEPLAIPTGRPLHVLLAEDNPVNQKVAQLLLLKEGHSVVTVGNGFDAVGAAGRERFDLILMDIQMPGMNGYEAAREIHSWETTDGPHVPIVALTAHAMKGDREICLKAGMDAYLSKPIQRRELRQVLDRCEEMRLAPRIG